MMTETLQHLIRRIPRKDVLDVLVRVYQADDIAQCAYERALDIIEDTQPVMGTALSGIIVDMVDRDGEPWADVGGIEPGYDEKFSIEFTPWAEWLPATVIRGTGAEKFSDAEMVAHILWEMTWISFDPAEIAKQRSELLANIEKSKTGIEG